jgi:hypothetical protein
MRCDVSLFSMLKRAAEGYYTSAKRWLEGWMANVFPEQKAEDKV